MHLCSSWYSYHSCCLLALSKVSLFVKAGATDLSSALRRAFIHFKSDAAETAFPCPEKMIFLFIFAGWLVGWFFGFLFFHLFFFSFKKYFYIEVYFSQVAYGVLLCCVSSLKKIFFEEKSKFPLFLGALPPHWGLHTILP